MVGEVPAFVPAADLSADFHAEVVQPLLAGRSHAAGLLGWGSDVLGYDTSRSTDHGWGPRLTVFLENAADVAAVAARLERSLPDEFRGWPVRFGWDGVAPRHHVTVATLPGWLDEFLGLDATRGMTSLDWLLTPQQRLLGVTAGRVHADDSGALGAVRRALRWYPDDVWRWLLACQWQRIAEEEAFVARTAEVGDDTGSAVIAARLVRDLMRLALLLDRRYAPYPKWLGTAFAASNHHDDLPDHLAEALRAPAAAPREAALAAAYRTLAVRQNASGLAEPVDPTTRAFHGRPAQVLLAGRFSEALRATVRDPALRALPLIGAVDQVLDSTPVATSPSLCRQVAGLYPGIR